MSEQNVAPHRMPRWVKMLTLIGLGLVVILVLLHLSGVVPGPHGHGSTTAEGVRR